jgi:[acyl-carrier-protein] S-malonyltransferase
MQMMNAVSAGTVFLFPGQGSQYVGMGKAFYETYPAVKRLFEEASDVAGQDLTRLCFEGPEATLVQTDNVQPAITLVNLACLQVLREEGLEPAAVAGHSVGEYAALCAAGALSFADTIRLVQVRGAAMRAAAERHPGGMVAVFGLGPDVLANICEEVDAASVQVANHNAPGQIVLTGAMDSVQEAAKAAKARGAKLVVPLKVSGPWHSRFMAGAQEPLRRALDACAIASPRIDAMANVTAAPYGPDPQEIRRALVDQIVRPVLWTQSMSALVTRGYRTFIETGPGRVLSGLLREVSRELKLGQVQDTDSLLKLRAALAPPPA